MKILFVEKANLLLLNFRIHFAPRLITQDDFVWKNMLAFAVNAETYSKPDSIRKSFHKTWGSIKISCSVGISCRMLYTWREKKAAPTENRHPETKAKCQKCLASDVSPSINVSFRQRSNSGKVCPPHAPSISQGL